MVLVRVVRMIFRCDFRWWRRVCFRLCNTIVSSQILENDDRVPSSVYLLEVLEELGPVPTFVSEGLPGYS